MMILNVLDLTLTLALIPFFGFLAVILLSAIGSRLIPSRIKPVQGRSPSRFLILIPAHDEAGVISTTVRSCRTLQYDPGMYTIWVIADNCTDGTAQEAREAGANVVERSDPNLRSKGHAMEYFFTQIPEGHPDAGYDAVVLIDADTVVAPDLLSKFDAGLAQGHEWFQGYYTVSNPDISWRTRMITFAFSLANGVWMQGMGGIGLSVGLKGNGMCFAASGLRRVPWRAYGLVEDMEFALMLRTKGERVRFLRDAVIYGEMVSKGGPGAASQRQRWEQGRRALRGKFAGPLARSRDLGLYQKAVYLLDLYFLPLSTLALGLGSIFTVDMVAWMVGGLTDLMRVLIAIHAVMVLSLVGYILSPVFVVGLPVRYLISLFALPYYIFWRLAVMAGRKPTGWVRTPRESPDSGPSGHPKSDANVG